LIDRIRRHANRHFENFFGEFQKYVAHKTELFVKEMDIENVATNETHINKLAKVLALNIACKYGVKKCEEFAEKKLQGWLENPDGKEENK